MPKKFAGENSKAVAAKARKTNAKEADTAKKQQQVEEAYWKDDDKQIAKKQQRKEEQEKKKQKLLEKKAENKMLLESEMSSLSKPAKAAPQPKITRAQIETAKVKTQPPKKEPVVTHLSAPLVENINRVEVEGEEARSVTEAISILSCSNEPTDKHPERRLKAAYAAFEEKRLPELKQENPSLKLSQMKQMIFKEWQKSPENPLNKS